jgi:LCP family protein required for cell wall assembly
MRTTMKRGVGRGAAFDGNGRAIFPPGTISAVARYRQPPPSGRTGLGLVRRILLAALLAIVAGALAVAGGAYLYFHQSVASVRAHSTDVKAAQKQLDVTLPGQAAIALVVGSDHRYGSESGLEARSDTIMLLRADPLTNTISMLSFPRDLWVEIHCPGRAATQGRINGAYADCGAKGTLATVQSLTGLPVNYLITVNFHGFRQIVDKLGGVWLDVDHRYYNKNVGTYETNYSSIDLQPGYQRLNATQSLEFVRYRHFDSDFFRLARQQEFVRAFKEQVAQNFSVRKLPSLVQAVTENVEVGAKAGFDDKTVLRYALFAATLPPGHFFQTRLENLTNNAIFDVIADPADLKEAIDEFQNPDVQAPRAANAAALGRKLKEKAPPPQQVSVTVLNGNGVAGSAGNAAWQLSQRGYRILEPPNGAEANAPSQAYFHTKIYFDPTVARAKAAAEALQKLMQPADVEALPTDRLLRALDPGSTLLVVVGTTFHGRIAPAPIRRVVKHQAPNVRSDRASAQQLLEPLARRVPFPLMVPTVLELSSTPDSAKPVRLYWIKKDHKAVRLVFRTGASEYWGIEETDWNDAPVLGDKSFRHALGGREFDLYYSGSHLHMVVLNANGATYWIVNTLLDSLSNETMIAIAKGLKPLTNGK